MVHSSPESVEDYDEDHGGYRVQAHGEYHQDDHGKHHGEDHGEYRDEDPGEYRTADHGEYHDEDHGEYLEDDDAEYHDEDHGEYAFETSEFRTSGASALVRNVIKVPGLKVVEFSAKSGQAWGVTSARVREKMAKAGATINYRVYSFTHPFDPFRREAAKKAEHERKNLASDRRKQREAAARGKAAARVAKAREGIIETLDDGT